MPHLRHLLAAVAILLATVPAAHGAPDAYVHVNWNEPAWGGVSDVDQDIAVTEGANQTYWAANWLWEGQSVGGYVGLQQGAPQQFGVGGKIALFSIWNAVDRRGSACGTFSGEGSGMTCRIPYNFKLGRYYKLRIQPAADSADPSRWWIATIQDTATGVATTIGSLETPEPNDRITAYNNFTEYFGPAVAAPYRIPESEAFYTQPAANRQTLQPLAYQYYSTFAEAETGDGTTANTTLVATRGTHAARVLMGARPSGHSRSCGYVLDTVAVTGVETRCTTARSVARRYDKGTTAPSGFACTRYPVAAAAGWFAICRKGTAQVRVTPE